MEFLAPTRISPEWNLILHKCSLCLEKVLVTVFTEMIFIKYPRTCDFNNMAQSYHSGLHLILSLFFSLLIYPFPFYLRMFFFFLLDDTCRDDKAYEAFCKDYRDNDFCTKYPYGMDKHCALTCGFCSKSFSEETNNCEQQALEGSCQRQWNAFRGFNNCFFQIWFKFELRRQKGFQVTYLNHII